MKAFIHYKLLNIKTKIIFFLALLRAAEIGIIREAYYLQTEKNHYA